MLTLTTSLVLFLSTMNVTDAQAVSRPSIEAAVVETVSNNVLTTDHISVSQLSKEITTVEMYVRAYFAKTPILAEIAKCESRFTHFNKNGTILRGRLTPEDVGVMQVNEYFHKSTATKLGINLHTLEGNLKYAEYLYNRSGTQPWSASANCWDK